MIGTPWLQTVVLPNLIRIIMKSSVKITNIILFLLFMELQEIIVNGQAYNNRCNAKLDGLILLFLVLMVSMKEEELTQAQLMI